MDWYPRYYYILKNKTSGISYIGQTVQDLEKYLGSGVYWKKHCKKYGGYNRENIILIFFKWFNTKDDAKIWLNNFEAENPEYWLSGDWANLIEENIENNPFHGPSLNNKKVLEGVHPFQRENKSLELIEKQSKTRFGTPEHKNAIIKKYGVDNIMKVPKFAEKSAFKQSITKKEKGIAAGIKNPNSKSVIVNGVKFSLMKEACEYFNVTTSTLNKYMNDKREVFLDLEKLEKRKKQTSNAVNTRRKT